jgi:hypothetical protein
MLVTVSTDKSMSDAAAASRLLSRPITLASCRFTTSKKPWRKRAWSLNVNA